MIKYNPLKQMALSLVLALSISGGVIADSTFECNFNRLLPGQVDGQPGWDVYDKGKDSSPFSVVTEVGITEESWDKALVVKESIVPLRCVTDRAVRWLRKQTFSVEFDFRVMVPMTKIVKDRPAMVLLVGNSVLNEGGRWEVRLSETTSGAWKLSAALPDEASIIVPYEKLQFTSRESTSISEWLHCKVEIHKLSAIDSFKSKVKITDRTGQTIAELECTDNKKDATTKAMWNTSRMHAGFYAAKEIHGLACIDDFRVGTDL